MASPVFLSPSWYFGAKMYELTFALFVPSYGAQDRTRPAQGGWDMRPRLFRVRLCESSAFWVSLASFFAALKSLHLGKPQIDSRIPCLNARKPWDQSYPTADFTRPHSRFEHRHETGFVALILHAAMRGWQNQFHFHDVSDF